jgi:hypothetical protein
MMMDHNLWFGEKNVRICSKRKDCFFVANLFAIEIPNFKHEDFCSIKVFFQNESSKISLEIHVVGDHLKFLDDLNLHSESWSLEEGVEVNNYTISLCDVKIH